MSVALQQAARYFLFNRDDTVVMIIVQKKKKHSEIPGKQFIRICKYFLLRKYGLAYADEPGIIGQAVDFQT